MAKKQLNETEKFFYILSCICSFGTIWISKSIIQKAIMDALED